MRMGELALGHGEVMRLMVRAARQNPDKAETAKVQHLLWIARRDREQYAVRQ